MKKNLLWMMAAILICGVGVFTSCTVDNTDNPAVEPDLNVAEKIIGKWMSAEINGKPFPTDNKGVYTFLTTSSRPARKKLFRSKKSRATSSSN